MEREELFKKFKVAVENEYEAYQMYKGIAEECGDPELSIIFDRLAREEWQHREIIMKRYSILKEYHATQQSNTLD